MNKFGILVFVFLGLCLVGFVLQWILKKRLIIGCVSLACFIALTILAVKWAEAMYAGGDVALARATFLVGSFFLLSILAIPFVKGWKIAVMADMVAFLALGVTFIILAVYLSKSVLQPNAELALLLF